MQLADSSPGILKMFKNVQGQDYVKRLLRKRQLDSFYATHDDFGHRARFTSFRFHQLHAEN